MPYKYIHPLLLPAVNNFDNQSADFYMYHISGGMYSGANSVWYACREQFHTANSPCDQFKYACKIDPDLIASMLMRTEMLLNISPLLLSSVHHCETDGRHEGHALCIKVSPWWKKYHARWHFLTVLLRAALLLRKVDDPILPCLMQVSYTQNTPRSLAKFLAGYNCHTVGISSWVNSFYLQNASHQLLRPTSAADLAMLNSSSPTNLTAEQKTELIKWEKGRQKHILGSSGKKPELNLD